MRQDLVGLDAFLAVAEKRSFRAAGEELGVTSSAISQTVRQLEERLGLQLFVRTTRSVALTDAGEQLRAGIVPAFRDMRATLASLNELKRRPAGTLRLSVSSIAEAFLSEGLLAAFLAEYPDIKLELAIDDSEADLVATGFDAGVHLGEVVAPEMVAVNVTKEERQIIVGSPAYLASRGKPKHPRDLHAHDCIGWRVYSRPAPYRWEFAERGKDLELEIVARVNTNEMSVMIRLALDGVGLSCGLERTFRPYIVRGALVPVLSRFCPPFPGFYLYYPSRNHAPAKLRALIEFLRKRQGTLVA